MISSLNISSDPQETLPPQEGQTHRHPRELAPAELAFVGDCVYELFVRERFIGGREFQRKTVEKVRASYQSLACERVLPLLTETEADIWRRGRNHSPKTIPKAATAAEYRRATALETLFGYLYLCGEEKRLRELFEVIFNDESGN